MLVFNSGWNVVVWSTDLVSGLTVCMISVGLEVRFIGRAFNKALVRLIRFGVLVRRDIIPARGGLELVNCCGFGLSLDERGSSEVF